MISYDIFCSPYNYSSMIIWYKYIIKFFLITIYVFLIMVLIIYYNMYNIYTLKSKYTDNFIHTTI